MPRPKDKKSLLSLSTENYSILLELLKDVKAEDRATPGVCEGWAVKDILSHLYEWHNMMIDWYTIGNKGGKPDIPAKGMSWKDTPKLNEIIFNKYKNVSYKKALDNLKKSHSKITQIIESHSNDELFTKKKYAWTGSTSMGAYFISATSSHYDWANKLIKKWLKNR